MTNRPSTHRADRAEARDTTLSLQSSAASVRCPLCRELCRDEKALEEHVDVYHPKFPPGDEESD